MKTNRLLAGTLAIVMITGIVSLSSAFAEDTAVAKSPVVINAADFALPSEADPEDIVYENGDPDPSDGRFIDFVIVADDFVLEESTSINDVHFILGDDLEPFGFNGPFAYEIRADDSGSPGSLIADGFSTNLEQEAIEDGPFGPRFLVWFDFEERIPLESGTTFWLVLHAGPMDDLTLTGLFWEKSNPSLIGNPAHIHLGDGNFFPTSFDNWFQITDKDEVVGGDFLPIDSTALLLAGLQSSAIWMLPVLAGVAGSAFGILYIKSRRN